MKIAKTSSDVTELVDTAKKFDQLGDYQDSRNLAEHCRKRAQEEQAKINAERERQRVLAEQKREEQEKKKKTITRVAAIVAVVVAAVIILVNTVIIPKQEYKAAEEI